MGRIWTLLSAGALAMSAFTAGAQPVAADPLDAFTGQQITWTPCGPHECATVRAPLDYADPEGGALTLALERSVHTGPTRLGTLIVNPGGPGAAATNFVSFVTDVAPQLAAVYDIVGIDPRGVGDSSPITCMTGTETTRWLLTDPTPDTAAEVRTFMSRATSIGRGCERMSPTLAAHIGTDASARDLDLVRTVLGDDTLNLLGFSYGTSLGTRYAELFPDRVGRFVLDGALDPTLDAMALSRGQSDAFQIALRRFATDCVHFANCVRRTPSGVIAYVNRMLTSLDANPMPAGRMGPLNEAQGLAAIFDALYSPGNWAMLRNGLRESARGSGAALQEMANGAWNRIGPNRYASNVNSAFYAISCWDFPPTPDAAGLRAAARAWAQGAAVPAMARASAWGNAPCTNWFGRSASSPHRVTTTSTAPILVVGTRYDPATPYRWAAALARQLPNGHLLTYEGDGHTAFGGQSACIDAAVTAYFLDGSVPPEGTRCH